MNISIKYDSLLSSQDNAHDTKSMISQSSGESAIQTMSTKVCYSYIAQSSSYTLCTLSGFTTKLHARAWLMCHNTTSVMMTCTMVVI